MFLSIINQNYFEPIVLIKLNFILTALLATLTMVLIYVLWGKRDNLNKLSLVVHGIFLIFLLNTHLNQSVFAKNMLSNFLNGCINITYYNRILHTNLIYFVVNFTILFAIFHFITEAEDVVLASKHKSQNLENDITCPQNYLSYIDGIFKNIKIKIIKYVKSKFK